ncbi:Aldedh-domain-containing protein [Armillaria gallica]|uniref:Aldedh-domain-containing protein n=1 Tax=Armillaria gallica TaxID=47427 RepID=A0A2H3DZK5_ARMGA|nr:Aldedh-domain-containing protein [Armillaria gallica]
MAVHIRIHMSLSERVQMFGIDIKAEQEFQVETVEANATYFMAGAVYYGGHHFTARYIDRQQNVWDNDGIDSDLSHACDGLQMLVKSSVLELSEKTAATSPFDESLANSITPTLVISTGEPDAEAFQIDDPSLRPTISEVVTRFARLCNSLTKPQLREPGPYAAGIFQCYRRIKNTLTVMLPLPISKFPESTVIADPTLRVFYTLTPQQHQDTDASTSYGQKLTYRGQSLFTVHAREEGAQFHVGGEKHESAKKGYFIQLTVFTGAKSMRAIQEEIFGPVAALIKFKTEEGGQIP